MQRIRSTDRSLLGQADAHLRAHRVLEALDRLDLWDDGVRFGRLPHSPESVRATPVERGWWLFGWNLNTGDASTAQRVVIAATAPDGVRLFLIDIAALVDAPGAGLRGPKVHIDVRVSAERAVGPAEAWATLD